MWSCWADLGLAATDEGQERQALANQYAARLEAVRPNHVEWDSGLTLQDEMTDRTETIGVGALIAKYTVTIIAVSIFPKLWPSHPWEAMGLGACVGCVLQYLIPPRGKPTATLFIFLFLTILAGVTLDRFHGIVQNAALMIIAVSLVALYYWRRQR